jgi:hypothetical protein
MSTDHSEKAIDHSVAAGDKTWSVNDRQLIELSNFVISVNKAKQP